jgi:hypothetical protein
LVKLLLDNVPVPAYNKHIDSDIAQSITHTEREHIMGQAKLRAKEIEQLKSKAKADMNSAKQALGPDAYYFQYDISGPSHGFHAWAHPTAFPAPQGKVKQDIEQAMGNSPISGKVSNSQEWLIHTATIGAQAIANGITLTHNGGAKALGLIGAYLTDAMKQLDSRARKIEIKLSSVESPFAKFGGDQFFCGFAPDSIIRVLDADDNVVFEFNHELAMA